MAYEILYLKVYFVFKRSSAIFHILQGYFCPLIWDSIFKTANTIWNILGSAYWLQSMQKIILGTFVYLFIPKIYSVKTKFSVLQTVQLRCYTFYWLTSQFCFFFWLSYSSKHWKKSCENNYIRFWKWKLKRTPQLTQNLFTRKSKLKFCIIFNLISFANA